MNFTLFEKYTWNDLKQEFSSKNIFFPPNSRVIFDKSTHLFLVFLLLLFMFLVFSFFLFEMLFYFTHGIHSRLLSQILFTIISIMIIFSSTMFRLVVINSKICVETKNYTMIKISEAFKMELTKKQNTYLIYRENMTH